MKKVMIVLGIFVLVTVSHLLAQTEPKTTGEFVIVDNEDRNYVRGIIVIYDKPQYRPAIPAWSKQPTRPQRKPLPEIPIEKDTIIPAGD